MKRRIRFEVKLGYGISGLIFEKTELTVLVANDPSQGRLVTSQNRWAFGMHEKCDGNVYDMHGTRWSNFSIPSYNDARVYCTGGEYEEGRTS